MPAPVNIGPVATANESARNLPSRLSIHIFTRAEAVEAEWRRFEQTCDCTAFQTFDWLAAWQRHVGERRGARADIIVGRFAAGDIALIAPLCLMRRYSAQQLCWLGQDLCDYNAPLLAADFSQRATREDFLTAWHELQVHMQCEPLLRHDCIELEKMPEWIGTQPNPFMHLDVAPNRSSAHLAHLGTDWKNSTAQGARRRRAGATTSKLRHMSQFGEVRFITATDSADACRTLEILMQQKGRALARKGIGDIFAPPGHREFFSTSPAIRRPATSFTSTCTSKQSITGRRGWL